MQKVRVKRQIADALNQRNRSRLIIFVMHNLFFDSNILV